MAGVMDPWANDHLLPPPPPNFEDLTTEQQFDYFRACGILPPLHPPADSAVVPAPVDYAAAGTFLGAMEDRDVKPFAAFFEAQKVLQHLAAEEHAAPFHAPVAPATFWVDAMDDDHDVKPPSASDVHAAAFEAHQFLPFAPAATFWPGGMDYYDDVKPPSASDAVDFEDPLLQFLAAQFPVPVAAAYPAAAATFWGGAMDYEYDVKPPSTSNVAAFEDHFLQFLAAAAPFPAPSAPAYPAAAIKEEAVAPAYIDASLCGMIKEEQ